MKKNSKLRLICFILALTTIFYSISVIGSTSVFAADVNTRYCEDEITPNDNLSNTNNIESVQPKFDNKTIYMCKYLYNLDDSIDYIYTEFENGGYVVFSRETMEMMEYSLNGTLPYTNSSTKEYYAGPSNYLQKEADSKFINLLTNEQIDITINEAIDFSQQIRKAMKIQSLYRTDINFEYSNTEDEVKNLLHSSINFSNSVDRNNKPKEDEDNLIYPTLGMGTLIPNYRYFSANPTHGKNNKGETYGNGNSGTCGSVAAQILLGYNNYYNDRRIINDRYLNGYDDITNTVADPENNPNYCMDPMLMTNYTTGTRSEATGINSFYSKVITTIMKPNTKGASCKEVYNGIKAILNEHLSSNDYYIVYQSKRWFLSPSPITSAPIMAEIDAGRPLIIGTSSRLGSSNHMVVGYGYQNYTYPDGSGTYAGYIVHYGWTNDNCVWINSSWCDGYIALKINHNHNYNTVGTIPGTNRTEYKCTTCGHRTDAAINMLSRDRYIEKVATLSTGKYQDYYLTFETAGNKLIQTFGANDSRLYLYDSEYNLLAEDDDNGYLTNAFLNYTVEADTPYILRVKFYSNNISGKIKIGLTPASNVYSKYENIWTARSTEASFTFSSSLNTTRVITFTPKESGTYKFKTCYIGDTRIDTYLYLVNPYSTDACLFNDDGAGDLQALITTDLVEGRTYFIVVSTYIITTSSGRLSISINKTS